MKFTAEENGCTVNLNKSGYTTHDLYATIEYSFDKETWENYTWNGNVGKTISLLKVNDVVYFRGTNSKFSLSNSCFYFVLNGTLKCGGDVTSLLNNIGGDTILSNYCFSKLFYGCTSLTTTPNLLSETLVSDCYAYMFSGCSKVNYIKALFLTTPIWGYTGDWVRGVKSTGTFVKNSAATWTTTGNNGIPKNWTVQTASS